MLSNRGTHGAPPDWTAGASLPQRQPREIMPPETKSEGMFERLSRWMDSAARDEAQRQKWLNRFNSNYVAADQRVSEITAQQVALEARLIKLVPNYQALKAAGNSPFELRQAKAQLDEDAITKQSLDMQYDKAVKCRQVNHILRTKMEEVKPLPDVTVPEAGVLLKLLGRLTNSAWRSDQKMNAIVDNISCVGVDPTAQAMQGTEEMIDSLIKTYGDPSLNGQHRIGQRGGGQLRISS